MSDTHETLTGLREMAARKRGAGDPRLFANRCLKNE
jgi:hypothetical protein